MFYHKELSFRILYSIPVIFVLVLIAGVYTCYIGVITTVDPSFVEYMAFALFHVVVALDIWAFLKCVATDPGGIPANYERIPASEAPDDNYCKKCQ